MFVATAPGNTTGTPEQMRQERFGDEQRAIQVDVQHALDRSILAVVQPAKWLNNPGIVDDAIDRSEPFQDLFRQRFDTSATKAAKSCA
jgi:hypothetical protein